MPILSRRAFAGTGVVVLAGGAGVAAEFLRHPRPLSIGSRPSASSSPPAPRNAPVLQAALARERALVARLEAAARNTPALKPTVTILLADHRAHADALTALVTEAGAKPTGAKPTAASAAPATATELRAWEKAAAAAMIRDCAASTGPGTAVLASIYACEQTHVAWLG